MPGCCNWPVMAASTRKRTAAGASAGTSGLSGLTATSRSKSVSRARRTTPMPPAPICSASSWRPASSSLWAAEERGFEHWLGCGAASSDIMARASRSRTVCIVLRDWAGNARPLCLVPRLRPAKAWRARAAGATPAPRFAKGGLVFAVCTGAWLSPRLQRGLGFASLALGRINVV